jgi:phospholipid/cholesterol/gamma-HCH transport system substrate-binding protein
MDLYYKQELTVGGFVLAALVVLIGGLMWLTGQSLGGGGRVTVPVQFTSIQGLTAGDPVMISGVSVGRVAQVQLEAVGRVIVQLEVNERVRPRVDAQASIRSLDFLGAKYVLYQPGEADALLEDGELIVGNQERDLATGAAELTDQASAVLQASRDLLSPETAQQVRSTLNAAERAMDVVHRVGSGPMVTEAESAITSLSAAAASLDSVLSNPDLHRSLAEMDEIAVGVREMTQGLAAVSQNLALMLETMRSPEGTVGRLLTDSTLYVDMHETMVSLRMLLDDVRERPGRYVNVSVF